MSKQLSEEKRQQWRVRICQQRESGLPIDRWCHQNQVSPHCFYYWRDRLDPKVAINRSCFSEIAPAKETGVSIECHGFRIHIDRYFDPATLKRCVSALSEVKC